MMARKSVLLMLVIALLAPGALAATQRFPWTFGMTKQEVRAVAKYGPYRAFSNGDLETYNGMLEGRKQDFQFFFKRGRLVRIGVDLYEGPSLPTVIERWANVYKYLREHFGAVATFENTPPSDGGMSEFMETARRMLTAGAEGQRMEPVRQPSDSFVFATLFSFIVDGSTRYYIFLDFDPPNA